MIYHLIMSQAQSKIFYLVFQKEKNKEKKGKINGIYHLIISQAQSNNILSWSWMHKLHFSFLCLGSYLPLHV